MAAQMCPQLTDNLVEFIGKSGEKNFCIQSCVFKENLQRFQECGIGKRNATRQACLPKIMWWMLH